MNTNAANIIYKLIRKWKQQQQGINLNSLIAWWKINTTVYKKDQKKIANFTFHFAKNFD